jgi:hypothetical protein
VVNLEYGHYQIQDEGFVEWLRQLELRNCATSPAGSRALIEIVGEDLGAQLPQLLPNWHSLRGAQVELGQQVFDRSAGMQSRLESCKRPLRIVGSVYLLQVASAESIDIRR